MTEVVDGEVNALGEWVNTKVGVSLAEQTIYDPTAKDENGRVSETNLGDLVTDAMRARSGADVAIDCAGSIRTNIPEGEFAVRDVLAVYPFGNHVTMMEITGQQLLDALEWGRRISPADLEVSFRFPASAMRSTPPSAAAVRRTRTTCLPA